MVVGLSSLPEFALLNGVTIATDCSGSKYQQRDDMALFAFAEGTTCTAVFTKNAFAAAPVLVARKHLANPVRYWLINAGNANAATGKAGVDDALLCCSYVADNAQVQQNQVLPFSTGVIGERLPLAELRQSVQRMCKQLSADNWLAAAKAIMTTDTLAKGVSVRFPWGGEYITINGIAKGAGMIHPNMATMLAFLVTDASCSKELLQSVLREAVDDSFHCITVDGDTSTNDAVAFAATAKSVLPSIDSNPELQALFAQHVSSVCSALAQMIIRDAEGASKYMHIEVIGADTVSQARRVAKTVAHSPLVKTAVYAADPNWGRIVCAIGYSREDIDSSCVDVSVNGTNIVKRGVVAANYTEEQGRKAFAHSDLRIVIDLHKGDMKGYCQTCDLGHEYVTINTEYRS